MDILILGSDGYIGKPLYRYLQGRGHTVTGVDNFSRRERAPHSLTPLDPPIHSDLILTDVSRLILDREYDAVVHLAQQPSASWSMSSLPNAVDTQLGNIQSTLSILWQLRGTKTHLVKLGSMGEYGTPTTSIPEGAVPQICLKRPLEPTTCPMGGMMFPRQPGSFYHLSKVFDSLNIEFACKTWGIRSTDIMQGVVFGLADTPTRFDYDEHFGTVLNRFIVQAISGTPLTVYGKGGQTRGFLPLRDSLECITLAIENPAGRGEYRVFNQYAKIMSVLALAELIQHIWPRVTIEHLVNPRVEKEEHIYQTTNQGLRDLGYNPTWNFWQELSNLLASLAGYKTLIRQDIIQPKTRWQ